MESARKEEKRGGLLWLKEVYYASLVGGKLVPVMLEEFVGGQVVGEVGRVVFGELGKEVDVVGREFVEAQVAVEGLPEQEAVHSADPGKDDVGPVGAPMAPFVHEKVVHGGPLEFVASCGSVGTNNSSFQTFNSNFSNTHPIKLHIPTTIHISKKPKLDPN